MSGSVANSIQSESMNEGKMSMLRLITAGNVDDGKSTLIGRLLYDSKSIFEDQLENIRAISSNSGDRQLNLAFLTDGLRAEREQGITIDVAYRYFATPVRKYILADTPGHAEFTRNMITGASTADVVLLLIDARHGVTEQTRRHAFISKLLCIPTVIICINKMDVVGFDIQVYDAIKNQVEHLFLEETKKTQLHYVPISALYGDNVVVQSEKMPWYTGKPLLETLNTVDTIHSNSLKKAFRLPVQHVIRFNDQEQRAVVQYAGRMANGCLHSGDEVMSVFSGERSKINSIEVADKIAEKAVNGMSMSCTLDSNFSLQRGDVLCSPSSLPRITSIVEATICWLSTQTISLGTRLIFRQLHKETSCYISACVYKLNVTTGQEDFTDKNIRLNDIVRVKIHTAEAVALDSYEENSVTGSFILIHPNEFETSAAGFVI